MYDSLKPWVNVPIQILPCTGRNGAGSKTFGDPLDTVCYPKEDVKLVVDDSGAEVVSTTQLYVDGSVTVKVTDEVIFEGSRKPIKRIGSFYRNGKVDVRVVYI